MCFFVPESGLGQCHGVNKTGSFFANIINTDYNRLAADQIAVILPDLLCCKIYCVAGIDYIIVRNIGNHFLGRFICLVGCIGRSDCHRIGRLFTPFAAVLFCQIAAVVHFYFFDGIGILTAIRIKTVKSAVDHLPLAAIGSQIAGI